jgi:hypothetical protein
MSICENMGYVVDITVEKKWDDTIENWIKQSSLLKGNETVANINGYSAILYKITDAQQVPSDVYILKHKGVILTVSVMSTEKDDDFNIAES